MKIMMGLMYAGFAAGYALVAALLFAADAWKGAVFLYVSCGVVIAIYWLMTGRFWPTETERD